MHSLRKHLAPGVGRLNGTSAMSKRIILNYSWDSVAVEFEGVPWLFDDKSEGPVTYNPWGWLRLDAEEGKLCSQY